MTLPSVISRGNMRGGDAWDVLAVLYLATCTRDCSTDGDAWYMNKRMMNQ